MSKYYNINGLKVRISDHEPNTALNGSSDINLYVCDAGGLTISMTGQIERVCERRGLDMSHFKKLAEEWEDGTYNKYAFKPLLIESEDFTPLTNDIAQQMETEGKTRHKALSSYAFSSRYNKMQAIAEIQHISTETGISKSFIRKYFNVR